MYPEPILRTRESQRRSLSVRFSLPLPSAKREQDTILNTTTIVSSEADMKPEIEEEASSFEDVAPSYKVIILTSPEVEQSNIQLNSTTPEVGIVSEMENSREDKAQVIYHDDLKYEIENENIDNYNEQKVIDRNDHVNTETYVVEDPSSAFANRRSREYHEKTCGDLETHKRQKLEFDFCKETTRLRDIIGHAAVKLRIEEIILPLGLPFEVADSVLKGIRSIPVSILLHGPPGCGKVRNTRIQRQRYSFLQHIDPA